jgi:hypothetical protein
MSDARRAWLWVSALVVIVVAGDHAFAWGLHKVVLRSQFRYSRLYRGGNDATIVTLGDSRGWIALYAPVIEHVTGRHVLNLCYNSMSPRIAEALLRDYLEHNPAPRLVILEVSSAADPDMLITELRTFAGLSSRLDALYEEQHPVAAVAGRLFKLFPLNSEMYLEVLHFMRRTDQDVIPSPSMLVDLRRARPRDPWVFLPRVENLAAMLRMRALLRQRNIELRFIITPYPPGMGPVNLAGFIALLEARVQTPVWNYAGAIDDLTAFADHMHMNARGSHELMVMLQRDGFFDIPSHRPVPAASESVLQ